MSVEHLALTGVWSVLVIFQNDENDAIDSLVVVIAHFQSILLDSFLQSTHQSWFSQFIYLDGTECRYYYFVTARMLCGRDCLSDYYQISIILCIFHFRHTHTQWPMSASQNDKLF